MACVEAEEVSDTESAASCRSEMSGFTLGSEDAHCHTDDYSYESSFVESDTESRSERDGYGSEWSLADECCVRFELKDRGLCDRRRAVVHSDSDAE